MVEEVKKTPTSEASSLKRTPVRKSKTSGKKATPKITTLKTPKIEANPEGKPSVDGVKKGCCGGVCPFTKKDAFRCLILILSLANLIVGIGLLVRLSNLQHWITMGAGGEANRQRLEAIYETPEYQKHFRGQVDSLEQQIQITNPAQ